MIMQKTGPSILTRFMQPSGLRQFSTAASIQARFEQAYQTRAASLKGKQVQK